jgi:hypothetical protein
LGEPVLALLGAPGSEHDDRVAHCRGPDRRPYQPAPMTPPGPALAGRSRGPL